MDLHKLILPICEEKQSLNSLSYVSHHLIKPKSSWLIHQCLGWYSKMEKFCLESDICPIAAGSPLDQQQYDEWVLIGYHSIWLLKVMENCGTAELELCGLVVKMYNLRQLFCNVHFKFWLMKKLLKILRKAKSKLARLLGHLSAFSFEVKFKARKDMLVSDTLSQLLIMK